MTKDNPLLALINDIENAARQGANGTAQTAQRACEVIASSIRYGHVILSADDAAYGISLAKPSRRPRDDVTK